jgi:hypothetical protein
VNKELFFSSFEAYAATEFWLETLDSLWLAVVRELTTKFEQSRS